MAAGRTLDRGRILAIGDSVRTDAIGAANAGLDLLFVTGSIHAGELDAFGTPDPAGDPRPRGPERRPAQGVHAPPCVVGGGLRYSGQSQSRMFT